MPRVTPPDTLPDDTLTRSMTRHRDTPSDTSSQDLQAQLAEAEKRAAVAEAELRGTRALVDEKQRTIDAQAQALRLLEPPRPATNPLAFETKVQHPHFPGGHVAQPSSQHEPADTSSEPSRGTWWGRLWGNS